VLNNENMAVWGYWEDLPGKTRPPYLDLCETTIRRFAGDLPVRIVTRAQAETLVTHLPELWNEMTVVQRSDYARVHLLLRYGGIWLDSDMICVRPLEQLIQPLKEGFTFVGYGDGGDNNLFAGLPNAPVLERWANLQDEALARVPHPTDLSWNALGSDILSEVLRGTSWYQMDSEKIAPVGWREYRVFFSTTYPTSRLLSKGPIVVALWNKNMSSRLLNVDTDILINSHMLLGRLIRHGLGISERPVSRALQRLHLVGDAYRRLALRRRVRLRNKNSD
jgi:hypothetical protein